ncbi:MAG: hypothetical protein KME25_11335 [Symplocastrum torsivum CPER-KK1]|uniref:Uncharacterized protein n=1 Tax=Symplocastrum torsivum CPER-KK1 TaxID=450513 RepID=A0A951U965_9CYAN|nr:hypothetical protein [Symplocastrum torsivum CPER-KK1]
MVFPQDNIFLAMLCGGKRTLVREETEFLLQPIIMKCDRIVQNPKRNLRSIAKRLSYFQPLQTGEYVSI